MLNESIYRSCTLCPRECHVDRTVSTGFCGAGHELRAARAALHMWEEPCISGTTGSGTVFFSGCTLRCVFCQNFQLSHENYGKTISASRLSDIFLELQEKGARKHQSRDRDAVRSVDHPCPWISQSQSFRSRLFSTAGDMKRSRRSGISPTTSISGFRTSNTWTAVSQKNTLPLRTILRKLPPR